MSRTIQSSAEKKNIDWIVFVELIESFSRYCRPHCHCSDKQSEEAKKRRGREEGTKRGREGEEIVAPL